jgi:hypothetical protein
MIKDTMMKMRIDVIEGWMMRIDKRILRYGT